MTAISFEFFPPKTDEQREALEKSVRLLKTAKPEYVSMTFGAGGSTLSHTVEAVRGLRADHGLDAAPHLSCMGGSRAEIRALLEDYVALGVGRIVALRGDLPSGMASVGDFRYASDLVSFIRSETGDHFRIEVACYPEVHPQANDAHADLANFKRKIEAGANGAITQYFYNADGYFRFVDAIRALGVDVPVVPGIMPIANFAQAKKFSAMCGASVPDWLEKMFEGTESEPEKQQEVAVRFATEQCQKLLKFGVEHLHFYTLNRADLTMAVCAQLGIKAPARA